MSGNKTTHTNSFMCPHNEEVHILKECCISECPFHNKNVSMFFKMEKQETNCVYYDSDIMTNVSDNRTQISALSRDTRRLISPKAVKESYDDALSYIKTKINLIHNISSVKHSCKCCGFPHKDSKQETCVSTSLCKSRQEWVYYVISLYGAENNISTKQLIWELLLTENIHLETKAKELGYSLCFYKNLPESIKNKINEDNLEKSNNSSKLDEEISIQK